MFDRIWEYLQAIVEAFVADDALSRGVSISFYTVTSNGPVLFIVVAIAGRSEGPSTRTIAVTCTATTFVLLDPEALAAAQPKKNAKTAPKKTA